MASNAIGMIETKGYVAALAAADAMVKAANVTITDRQQVGDGLVAVIVTGEVGAVKAAAEAGATAVVQPGGSIRDDEVIAAANAHGMAMVLTGERHFRHREAGHSTVSGRPIASPP